MKIETLHDLFEHHLQDIYFAEQKLLKTLKDMGKESENPDIKSAYAEHRRITEKQIERLKEIFKSIGKAAKGKTCAGILGIIKENKDFKKENPTEKLTELFNLASAAKVERYEISAYEALIDSAKKHEMNEVIPLLEQNLREEEEALDRIKQLVETYDTSKIAAA